jgi:hypothetical protein
MLARRWHGGRSWIPAGIGFVLLSAVAGPVGGQTTATWTGGAGTQNYSDPNNWSIGLVPLNNGPNTYSVVIPGSVTVRFDVDSSPQSPGTVTDFSLAAVSTFIVNPGHAYVVLDDAQIAGVIQGDHGTFLAEAAGAAFTGNRGQAFALGAGYVSIAATTYSATGLAGNYTLFSADGAGTGLNLATLQSINAGWNYGSGVQVNTVTATAGASLDLSGVQTMVAPCEAQDRLDVLISNDATLNLNGLQSVSSACSGDTRFAVNAANCVLPALQTASNAQFDLASAATLDLPALITHAEGSWTVGNGAVLTSSALENLTGVNVDITPGGAAHAPQLTSFGGSVTLSPGRVFETGWLSDIDNARFWVIGGQVFDRVTATNYSSLGLTGNYTLFSADGAGTILDLSSLQSLYAGWNYGSGLQVNTVTATAGATLDLSGVQTVTAPCELNDRLDLVVSTNATLNLSGLQNVATACYGSTRFAINTAGYSLPALQTATNARFEVAPGASLNLPALVVQSGGTWTVGTGGVLTANTIESLTGATVDISAGGAVHAPQLTEFGGSATLISPDRVFETGLLTNIDNARLVVGGGQVYDRVVAPDYSSLGLTGGYTLFSASGAGTVFDLSSLQSINAGWNYGSGTQVNTINATAGAALDLSGVRTITAPCENNDRLDIVVDSGATIDLSALQVVQSACLGHTKFVVGGGASMLFGDLTVSGLMDVALTDITSVLDVAGNLLLDSGTFNVTAGAQVTVGKNFTFRYTTEANMDAQSGIVQLVGQAPQFLEVGGSDVGIPPGTGLNFGIGQLVVGADNVATVVQLMETIDNGNRNGSTPEALYLYGLGGPDGLRILGGSTLRLNALHCYAKLQGQWVLLNDLFPQGEVEIPFDNGFIRRDAGTQIVGDLNCDGTLNFDDINAFVLALSDPDTYAAVFPDCYRLLADCNGDHAVNFDDINAFVALLSGG